MTKKLEMSAGKVPEIGASQIELLEKLCNATAVSGDEYEVRQIVLEAVKLIADEVKVDALGNVLATKFGRGENRVRVMLAAHMDEIGLMVVKKHDDGVFEFDRVGGIDERQLPGKSVVVGRDHLPGVIGAKPIHMTTADERKNKIDVSAMRIDLGPEIGEKVKPGDRATFATRFELLGPSIRAKALDDRFGVATLIELLKHAPDQIDLMAAFTVQEEVGLRGARVAAYALDPDMAIAIDATPAYDLPPWDDEDENDRYNTRLDAGPAIYVMDFGTIPDRRLVNWLVETAIQAEIPYQLRQPGGGGTDAGAIHKVRVGIPSVSVSVPVRYAHTAASIARLDDWANTLRLLHTALGRVTPDLLAGERRG
jgi:putative aminopeptidase FrvX